LFAERRAAAYWYKSTGYAPPGYEEDAKSPTGLMRSIAKDDD
jgi:hypothetical protein